MVFIRCFFRVRYFLEESTDAFTPVILHAGAVLWAAVLIRLVLQVHPYAQIKKSFVTLKVHVFEEVPVKR